MALSEHTPQKKWRRGRPDAGGAPDLLNRDFRADCPNQRWVADITEFPTGDGKIYLAAVRDLFHRGIWRSRNPAVVGCRRALHPERAAERVFRSLVDTGLC